MIQTTRIQYPTCNLAAPPSDTGKQYVKTGLAGNVCRQVDTRLENTLRVAHVSCILILMLPMPIMLPEVCCIPEILLRLTVSCLSDVGAYVTMSTDPPIASTTPSTAEQDSVLSTEK